MVVTIMSRAKAETKGRKFFFLETGTPNYTYISPKRTLKSVHTLKGVH